ncbi:DUF3558 domain-containing protein [Nocardia camponoti]|uniref:DUF3558 domain-containing protein n=1 Tax=Nocardia camponoti TaxID=1616106 RepID=A0A917QSM0_9NOCA|nr:DUF3558 domain-containing protein [Nocardia camponoti]GGK65584.1 hypothetical protein GCM10011591_42220 [Nocardia camponoti]
MIRATHASLATVAASAFVLMGCTSDPAPTPEADVSTVHDNSTVRPTLTNPKIQPPDQDNKYTRSTGRPHVVFDPCTWIMPADLASIGYLENTRKRGVDVVAEYSFLSCHFESEDMNTTLAVNSGNVTWDEDQQKNGSWLREANVNGRQASQGQDPNSATAGKDSCEIHMRTKVGVVLVSQLLRSFGEQRGIDPCANLDHIASVVEKSIGKEN